MAKSNGHKFESSTTTKTTEEAETPLPGNGDNPFAVSLSLQFILGAMFCVSAVAFGVGRLSASLLLLKHAEHGSPTACDELQTDTVRRALPPPVYSEQKQIPRTVYSSKNYDISANSLSDTLLARRARFGEWLVSEVVNPDGNLSAQKKVESTEEGDLHEPSGHHLTVDIKNVDGVFLNSVERLASAMIDLVELSGLTWLSYHCHQLQPVGVSCVGVLLQSHISFHTWPIPGAISLDMFNGGPDSLLPMLPEIERLFGVPRSPAVQGSMVGKPFMQWAHKKRGFRSDMGNPVSMDLEQFVLGWMEFDMKQLVVSVETDFQTIEIYDLINPRFKSLASYEKSLANDGSYEARHPELFRPDRVVYLDGILQSRFYGEAAYHEALAHPAMIMHANPKRVAIIGGGAGATLREVLKHKTVETVTMIEIDEILVNLSREHVPEWSDCSMLVGSTPSCFDDPRAELYYADAVAWFAERFSDHDKVDASQLYDVIIIDRLDHSSVVVFSDVLYGKNGLVRSLTNAIGEEGILVAQVGEGEKPTDAGAHYTNRLMEFVFTEHLKLQGFEVIQDYTEAHGGLLGVWKYKIAMKSKLSFERWHFNQAMIDLELHDRAVKIIDGVGSPFRFFDGATMMGYQYPSRINEEIFCRDTPTPQLCEIGHGWDPERHNAQISTFEVKISAIPNAGRGVFANEDIPVGSYVSIDEAAHCVLIMPATANWIVRFSMAGIVHRWRMFNSYMYGYGFESDYFGKSSYSVDGGILTFINHGCDGSNNLTPLRPFFVTEMTADLKKMPDELKNCAEEVAVYDPFVRRNHLIFQHAGEVTRRNIKAGEEILDSYLNYVNEETWEIAVLDLRAQCLKRAKGSVSAYEEASK